MLYDYNQQCVFQTVKNVKKVTKLGFWNRGYVEGGGMCPWWALCRVEKKSYTNVK